MHKKPNAAFSLIELLVVCGIIAIIAGFAIPASLTMMKGSQLTQAAQVLTDQISLARQTALARNRSVEVRIYRFSDPEAPGEKDQPPSKGKFRAFQLFEILENGAAVPIGKYQRLPQSVIVDKGAISSLIKKMQVRQADRKFGDPELSLLSENKWSYEMVTFRFLPDGSTDLNPTDRWFLTIHGSEAGEDLNDAPPNFFTLQVDPVSGSTRTYRPNAG
jgi:uncharacterized protein (TIGR02596 family)